MKKRLIAIIAVGGIGLTGCTNNTKVLENQAATPSSQSAQSETHNSAKSSNQATTGTTSTTTNQGQATVTEAEAMKIALEHFNLSEDNITVIKNVLDTDDGIQVYEIELQQQTNAAYQEYECKINATTGAVMESDSETKHTSGGDNGSVISETEVKQIVLKKVSGATEADISYIKRDTDDGVQTYEGKLIYNELEYEFEINAATGEIRSWETDSIYD